MELKENRMELKDIKKENLREAKKQVEVERTNAEIEFAKETYREATNIVDTYDRKIKELKELKEPYLEIIKKFKGCK